MTDQGHDVRAAGGATPWTSPVAVVLVIGLLLAAKLAAAAMTDLVGDEAYYTLWAFYPLQPGYYDHPPAVAWFIRAGQVMLGDTALASRIVSVVGTAVCALAVWRTAVALFADRTIAALATLWFSLSIGAAVGLLIITPDAPSTVFWILAIWTAAELHRSGNGYWWLAFGLFAGLGLQAKYTGFFLGAGILLWLVAWPEARRWFRSWQLYAGGILALAIFWPVMQWNIDNEFASLKFQLGRSSGITPSLARGLQFFPEFVATEAAMLLPGLFLFVVAGFVLFVRRGSARRDPGLGLLVATAAPALLYFVWHTLHDRVQGNWPLPLFGQLALIGAWAAVSWAPSGARQRAFWLWLRRWEAPLAFLVVLALLVQVVFAPLKVPARLPTDDMAGWSEVAGQTARLAEETGAKAVFAHDYILVSQFAVALRFEGHELPALPAGGFHHFTFVDLPVAEEIERPILVVKRSRPDDEAEPKLEFFGGKADYLTAITREGPGGRVVDRLDFYFLPPAGS